MGMRTVSCVMPNDCCALSLSLYPSREGQPVLEKPGGLGRLLAQHRSVQ